MVPGWKTLTLTLTSTPCLSNCCVQHCRFINYRAGQAGPGPAACASFLIKLTSNALTQHNNFSAALAARGPLNTEYTEYQYTLGPSDSDNHLQSWCRLFRTCLEVYSFNTIIVGIVKEPMSRSQGVGVSRESVLFSSRFCINFSHFRGQLLWVLLALQAKCQMSSE